MTERILRLPEVEERTGYKKSAIYQKMHEGCFPALIKIGPRASGCNGSYCIIGSGK